MTKVPVTYYESIINLALDSQNYPEVVRQLHDYCVENKVDTSSLDEWVVNKLKLRKKKVSSKANFINSVYEVLQFLSISDIVFICGRLNISITKSSREVFESDYF